MAEDEVHTLCDCVQVCEGWAPSFANVRRKCHDIESMCDLVRSYSWSIDDTVVLSRREAIQNCFVTIERGAYIIAKPILPNK